MKSPQPTDMPLLLRPALLQFMNSLDGMLENWADVQATEEKPVAG